MSVLPIPVFLIIGFGALALMRPPARTLHPVGWAALAWWLGALLTAVVLAAGAVITRRFHFWLVWMLAAGGLGALVWKGGGLWREARAAWNGPVLDDGPAWARRAAWIISAALAVFAAQNVYFTFSVGSSYPLISFDAINNFAHKAQMWFTTRELFPEPLLDEEYLMYKRRYPPVVPVIEALWAAMGGGWDGRRVKVFFLICWLSVGVLVWARLRRNAPAVTAWLGAGLWLAVPMNQTYLFGGAISGFADVPLAMAFMAGAAAADELRRRRDWPAAVLAGLLLAGAFWIKKEGLLFWGAAMLYLLWTRAGVLRLGAVVAIAAVFFALHQLMVRGLPSFLERDVTLALAPSEILARVQLFPTLVLEELGRSANWGRELWFIYAVVWIYKLWRLRWRRWLSLELWLFGAMAVAFSAILILTIHSYGRNFDWAFERLLIQILPLFIAGTLAGFSPVAGEGQNRPSRPSGAAGPTLPETVRGA
ncbi:MAG: hypothetical protein Kow0059_11570 [Candidatus Sumerlaeia bacterium]